jgi:serine/threonine protein kinase
VGKTVFTVDVRYRNLKPIGSGSYGIVCSGDDFETKRKVAIKKVGKVFEDLVDAKRILRELKLLGHLGSHENLIGATDIMTQPPVSENMCLCVYVQLSIIKTLMFIIAYNYVMLILGY